MSAGAGYCCRPGRACRVKGDAYRAFIGLQLVSSTSTRHVWPNHDSPRLPRSHNRSDEIACHDRAEVAPHARSRSRLAIQPSQVWQPWISSLVSRGHCHCSCGFILRQHDAAHSKCCSSHHHCYSWFIKSITEVQRLNYACACHGTWLDRFVASFHHGRPCQQLPHPLSFHWIIGPHPDLLFNNR